METKKQVGQPPSTRQKIMTRGLSLPIDERQVKNALYSLYRKEVECRKNEFYKTDGLIRCISIIGDFLVKEQDKYGLFIPGHVGNGKTTMMKAIRDLLVYTIDTGKLKYCEGDKYPRLINANSIAEYIVHNRDEYRRIKTTRYLFIDDLGTEQTDVVSWGMVLHPFLDILCFRYDHLLPTFISSNLSAADIAAKYSDERITDRMAEMFKIVSFKGGTFR